MGTAKRTAAMAATPRRRAARTATARRTATRSSTASPRPRTMPRNSSSEGAAPGKEDGYGSLCSGGGDPGGGLLALAGEEPAAYRTVVAEGVGQTAEDARKDAFRNAVRQAVGALIDAETLVQNDQVIKDEVLTYSNALVKSYKEVDKPK